MTAHDQYGSCWAVNRARPQIVASINAALGRPNLRWAGRHHVGNFSCSSATEAYIGWKTARTSRRQDAHR